MCSILDIDLDYFNQINDPHRRLEKLLTWAGCPVMVVVENHNEVLKKWKGIIKKMNLTEPPHIRLFPNLSKVNVAQIAILTVSDAVPRVYGIC